MQCMSAAEIRTRFLKYFERNGHVIRPSSSLVPVDDPTLLFTNAGMVQFKDVFTGKETLPFSRAVTAQKCVRAGGKHNDLENVGKTARHHTFFEMLGNFSFGDYFKREAIQYCWEFLTGELGLPPGDLWVTIYEDDDEAFHLWQEIAGVPASRIVRMGEADNFWSMGDTGPCGPCSEVIIDRGPGHSCSRSDCALDTCGCDRWLELWNLVFMQYDRDAEGNLTPLPKPSIDTGMGLERIASVMQGVNSNFETDLFVPIIEATEELTGRRYSAGEEGFPFRVIADHIRAGVFLIADDVFPSNEFRGYVLRRIMRRAIRFGKLLGMEEPFLYQLVPVVGRIMGDAYPEVVERADFVTEVIRNEEERFHRTLHQGLHILDEMIRQAKAAGKDQLSGEQAFTLYDTYGFPLDLTEDALEEHGMTVDREGFQKAMEAQRERARSARQEQMGKAGDDHPAIQHLQHLPPTTFLGYETLAAPAQVVAILKDGQPVDEAGQGEAVEVVLDQTPFYAEAGGQVGDTGRLVGDDGVVAVADVQAAGGHHLHRATVVEGRLRVGDRVQAQVDAQRRWLIMRNHTATHLAHKALKLVVGEHVNQAGSLVAPDRFRFDFTHLQPLTPEQVQQVEDLVNEQIMEAIPVTDSYMPLKEARAAGAMALFGEKYGDIVRVVRIGDFSLELCGGTHVENTGQIGLFKISSEGSVGAGVRRIEAVTGPAALKYIRNMEKQLAAIAETLRCAPPEAPARVSEIVKRQRDLERELARQQAQGAKAVAAELVDKSEEIDGVRVVVARVDAGGADELRQMGDIVRDRLGSAVVVLGAATSDGKVMLVAMATPDVVDRGFHAGKLIGQVARLVGGGGGGRPHSAQAGGKDASGLDGALEKARQLIREEIGG